MAVNLDGPYAGTAARSVMRVTRRSPAVLRIGAGDSNHIRARRPETSFSPPLAVATPPAPSIVASPPAVYRPAASETQIVAAPPPPPPPVLPVAIPLPPPPPVAKPIGPAWPAPQVERVGHETAQELADSPIGNWQTEGKGVVRIVKCGNALYGYVLNSSSQEKGEAVLINMKPRTDRQWTGSVYSQDSGDTYYGTMDMKGLNMLRVEACALGRVYCSSNNNWSRISDRAENLVTSRQMAAEPRS